MSVYIDTLTGTQGFCMHILMVAPPMLMLVFDVFSFQLLWMDSMSMRPFLRATSTFFTYDLVSSFVYRSSTVGNHVTTHKRNSIHGIYGSSYAYAYAYRRHMTIDVAMS